MTIESNIFDDVGQIDRAKEGFYDFKLLKTTTYATLYIAFKSGKRFLVKTPKDKSEWQERLLRREFELALDVEHPNIVHLYTLEHIAPYGVAIVMEYVDGRTLGEYLRESPSRRERERIFLELLLAVEYLHRRGVVHNDLKPDNILISRASDTLKLIDFGLADSDAEYAMRTLGYTPRYASQELRMRGAVDARSDIYSLGVIREDIFGSSRVSRRATRELASQRYGSVAELRSAWRPRHIWWVVALVLVLLLGGIGYLSIYNIDSDLPRVEKSVEPLRDTVYVVVESSESDSTPSSVAPISSLDDSRVNRSLAHIEQSMEAMYRGVVDSLSVTRYSEFATPHFQRFWRFSDSLSTASVAMAHSEEERALLSARCDNLKYHYFTRLSEQLDSIPSVLFLEGEERNFYLSLLGKDLPFREYSPEE
jgi:serine/threonine protein kinase